MTDKELKHLRRDELLELLLAQAEKNELLSEQLEQVKHELESKRLEISNAGSIASAALSINGVFQSADNAAKQYIDNVQALQREQERTCAELVEQAEKYCTERRAQADAYYDEAISRARAIYEAARVFESAGSGSE